MKLNDENLEYKKEFERIKKEKEDIDKKYYKCKIK